MEEFRCNFCDTLLGYVKNGKLFNANKKLVSESGFRGYCLRCNNLNVWSPEAFVPAEDIESVPPVAPVIEVPTTGIPDTAKNPAKPDNNAGGRQPRLPVFVSFGDSKIYHLINHFENKVDTAKVVTDTTGYRLCKICDGFVNEGANE
jgi:hypothetical protein